jgi:hypothetical protein
VAATGVRVRAAVVASPPWPLDAYITTAIGPLASPANVVASTTINVVTPPGDPNNPEMVALFSGLDLGPGTHYLVLATSALSTINILGWYGEPSLGLSTVTAAPGFSLGGREGA